MRYLIKLLILLSSVFIFWCIAKQANEQMKSDTESFLIADEPQRRKNPSQVRQDIAQIMGEILELESACIAIKAQIQQELCKHIRSIAENEAESVFKEIFIK